MRRPTYAEAQRSTRLAGTATVAFCFRTDCSTALHSYQSFIIVQVLFGHGSGVSKCVYVRDMGHRRLCDSTSTGRDANVSGVHGSNTEAHHRIALSGAIRNQQPSRYTGGAVRFPTPFAWFKWFYTDGNTIW